MIQIKVLQSTPDLMERDVNQFLQSLSDNPQYSFKVIDTKYSIPSNGKWYTIITYTMTPKQRTLAPKHVYQINPSICSGT